MNCKWTLEVVGYREENPSGLKKFYPGTHYFQSREEVEEFANELTNPTGNVKPKQNSGTRYLGCSGNVPIFSDNFSAAGANPKADDQEQPTRNSDGKEEESTSSIASIAA